MAVSQLLPWKRNRSLPIQRSGALSEARDPFLTLYREMNRLFDEVWNGFGWATGEEGDGPSTWLMPNVDLVETDQGFRVTAELPGVEEKDLEILLADNTLILRGEKKSAHDNRQRRLSECYYGRFERRIPLPEEVDQDKVEASFKNGVLTVLLPKHPQAQQAVRRIALKAA
jgi:HSP20 family protein